MKELERDGPTGDIRGAKVAMQYAIQPHEILCIERLIEPRFLLQGLAHGRIGDALLASQDVDHVPWEAMHEGKHHHRQEKQHGDQIEDTVDCVGEHKCAYSIQAVRMPPPRVLKAPETDGWYPLRRRLPASSRVR